MTTPRSVVGSPCPAVAGSIRVDPAVSEVTTNPISDGAEVLAMVDALLATGATLGEAFAQAVHVHSREAVLPCLVDRIMAVRPQVYELLQDVGAMDPDLAQMGLDAWLEASGRKVAGDLLLIRQPWVVRLPEGLEVRGDLCLQETPIASLPRNLKVSAWLTLRGSGVVSLPEGLQVGGLLDIMGAVAWDGQIPEDAKIGNKLFTDQHEGGIWPKDWFRVHPNGESR